MMNGTWKLSTAILGTAATIVLVRVDAAIALSGAEVSKIAKSTTVRVVSQTPGSGVIIKREANTYTVLTAAHVVATADDYEVIAPDGQVYPASTSSIQKLPNVDLALLTFNSSQLYTVIKVGNSNQAPEGASVYVAGFPNRSSAITDVIYTFTDGKITANATRPLQDGYALVYSNNTLPGMSGGPVLDQSGALVGIHGRADTTSKIQNQSVNPEIYIKTGFNLGIPINTFLSLVPQTSSNLGLPTPAPQPATTQPTADDFYLQGGSKLQTGDYQGAIADFTQAIQLKPSYAKAYASRQKVYFWQGDYQGAINDGNKAIELDPSLGDAYIFRGFARFKQGDNPGQLSDLNKAVELNPQSADAHSYRGYTRYTLGDFPGALADANQAVQLDPQSSLAYAVRGIAYTKTGDARSALADSKQAIQLNPKAIEAFYARAVTHLNLKKYRGAITASDQALEINPNFVYAYIARATARYLLGQKQDALSDLDKAISLNPRDPESYAARGLARLLLGGIQSGDTQGALSDVEQALQLNPNLAVAYAVRGIARFRLGDKQAASADLDKALLLDPNQNVAKQARHLFFSR